MSRHILILGAGRSSAALIQYLAGVCSTNEWKLTVGDVSAEAAARATSGLSGITSIRFDIADHDGAASAIGSADAVISLLPAHLHVQAARHCLTLGKHLITASYVSDEMLALHQEASQRGLLFLNECGLDPGIDHMSAMQVIDRIRSQGGHLHTFRSFTGGLIAPETDPSNPWRYKFTWNARNVVMAGQSVATYLEGGKVRRIPYQKLFTRLMPVRVAGTGNFDGYANRDSLKYIDTYGLSGISTMLRGTLRFEGFCQAWNLLVQLGICDDTLPIESASMTHGEFLDIFLPPGAGGLRNRFAVYSNIDPGSRELDLIDWVGLFSDESIGLQRGTPAAILEHILNKKWKMNPGDLDLIVMWHQFGYSLNGADHEIQASLVSKGTDDIRTAMAATVGLPLGIATRLLLEGKITSRGVASPVTPEFYDPSLTALRAEG
ncbi:MAG: saccharopine dehydrogenase C-terminal domain-containing protein, partial [Bacteroidota bacterium]